MSNECRIAVTVRAARVPDLPAIGDLWEELMDYHLHLDVRFRRGRGSREAFLRHLKTTMRSPDHLVLVAEADRNIAGFLLGRVEYGGPVFEAPDFGYITDACVEPAFRRYGVGKALFDGARDWFLSKKLTNIRVSVSTVNEAAMGFWRDMGFKPFMERLWFDLT